MGLEFMLPFQRKALIPYWINLKAKIKYLVYQATARYICTHKIRTKILRQQLKQVLFQMLVWKFKTMKLKQVQDRIDKIMMMN